MLKVLIVDDSEIMRNIVSVRIKECGFKVIGQASCGYEAVQEYKLLKPDIVTIAISMPEINQINNGTATLKCIKEFDPNAYIIMVTSHGEECKVIEAINAGAKGYILKPVTLSKIKKVFQKFKSNTNKTSSSLIIQELINIDNEGNSNAPQEEKQN